MLSSISIPLFFLVIPENQMRPKCCAHNSSPTLFAIKWSAASMSILKKCAASRGRRDATACECDLRAAAETFPLRSEILLFCFTREKRARHVIDEIDVTAPVYREMTNGFCGIASLVPPLSIAPHATPKQSPLANRLSTFVYWCVDDAYNREDISLAITQHPAAINDQNWKSQISRPISVLFHWWKMYFTDISVNNSYRKQTRYQQIAQDKWSFILNKMFIFFLLIFRNDRFE